MTAMPPDDVEFVAGVGGRSIGYEHRVSEDRIGLVADAGAPGR